MEKKHGLTLQKSSENISKKGGSGHLKESRVFVKQILLNSGMGTQAKTSSMNTVIRTV